MTEFIHFLLLCAEYTRLWDDVFKNPIDADDDAVPEIFDKLYNALMTAQNDMFVYAAIHGVYPSYNADRTVNIIRKAFAMMKPTVLDCRIIPPKKSVAEPNIHPMQVMHQATVIGDLSDGSSVVLFRYFEDELSFTPSEFIGLTYDEAVELFHKKDIEYLRS